MIRTKAGQSENLADHVVAEEVGNTALSVAPISPTSQPDTYSPQVGDVVEFEYKGMTCQGLIFQHRKDLAIVSNFDHEDYYTFSHGTSFGIAMETIRKIGETNLVKARHAHDEVIRIAEAYFAQPKFTADPDKSYAENQAAWVAFYGLEVGSKVKVIRPYDNDEGGCTAGAADQSWIDDMGEIGLVTELEPRCIKARHTDKGTYNHPYFALEPA